MFILGWLERPERESANVKGRGEVRGENKIVVGRKGKDPPGEGGKGKCPGRTEELQENSWPGMDLVSAERSEIGSGAIEGEETATLKREEKEKSLERQEGRSGQRSRGEAAGKGSFCLKGLSWRTGDGREKAERLRVSAEHLGENRKTSGEG